MRKFTATLGAVSCCVAITSWAQKVDTVNTGSDETVTKRLDPTDFKTRIEGKYEYQSTPGGGSRSALVPRLDYAISKSLLLRVETPYLFVDPDRLGQGTESGFGDLLVRINYRAAKGPGYAIVPGLELIFDTAEDDRLGSGKTIVSPAVFASINLSSLNSILFPSFQQYVSVAGPGANDVNFTQLRAGVLTRLPDRYYTFLEPTLFIDWELDAHTGFTLELELGRLLTQNFGVFVRPGVGLWGNNLPQVYNWSVEVGFRYLLD